MVIDHINLRIEKGKIYGFIGQNFGDRGTEPVSRSSEKGWDV